jgi:hypothetical protein
MRSAVRLLAATTAAFALCATPAMAATSSIQPISPLIAVSVYGTQASAQTICAQGAAAAAAAAAAAQGQSGCVLPATDVPPPVASGPVPPPLPTGNFGINWLLAGLGALALIGGLSTLFDDDDDEAVSAG